MKKLILALALLTTACAGKETGLAPAVQIPPLPGNLAQKSRTSTAYYRPNYGWTCTGECRYQ